MVDGNMSPPNPGGGTTSSSESTPSPTPQSKMSQPSVVQAGQMMLIFALVLIFLVCCALALHFHLRRQKRKRRKRAKEQKKEEVEKGLVDMQEAELQSKERKIVELHGTPICEIGESEPRHEMEDVEVPERRYTLAEIELENPADTPVAVRTERELEEGTYFGEMTTREELQPEARVYAAYWARTF